MTRLILAFLLAAATLPGQTPSPSSATAPDDELRFVIYLSRHGVRSPTGKAEQYNQYSAAPWPAWPISPGYLTPHGYRLIQDFGAYDRTRLAAQGLFAPTGCPATGQAAFYADSDQRTQQTGKALAEGLFPGCIVPVHSLPEGIPDPLFHPTSQGVSLADAALARAAIAGRIGDQPEAVTLAFHAPLTALDHLLASCGTAAIPAPPRTSLFSIPASLTTGKGDHAAELRGPLSTASTLTENLLLEYTEGLPKDQVGWGCVDGVTLRSLLDLHTAASDLNQRTPAIARLQAYNLLNTIAKTMQQAVDQRPVAGALGSTNGRALFLIGHDTNLSNIAGLFHLTWILDGRRDDTPPGSTLIFELHRSRSTKRDTVRVFFTAQTLEQMRDATRLKDDATSPPRVPVFLPDCSRSDFACAWPVFARLLIKANTVPSE